MMGSGVPAPKFRADGFLLAAEMGDVAPRASRCTGAGALGQYLML